MNNAYTREEMLTIQEMAAQKCSAKDIAAKLPRHTRNSIIGFCRRRAIKLQYTSERRIRKAAKAFAPNGATTLAFASKKLPTVTVSKARDVLKSWPESCRFLAGEPREFRWCKQKPHKHRPYCISHFRVVYQGFQE